MDARMIRVWRFADAPESLRAQSEHGGDEDWLALVPVALAEADIGWLDSGTAFGRSDVTRHPQQDGSVVYIGAHA
jgi:hypothetical protein